MAQLIRSSLEEYGLDKPGTAGRLRGNCPGNGKTAELQKLYVSKKSRGKSCSSGLLKKIFQVARDEGDEQLYLETCTELSAAVAV
ncbi:acetyltransferase, GNAT family [Streptococcus sp. DD11]|nr:acetyltransferase, GNAT family [Streptococcus sp. DD11]